MFKPTTPVPQTVPMNTVERAFQLARSGEIRTMEELKAHLRREQCGSIDVHLGGKLIKTQLRKLMDEATRRLV